MGRRNSWTMREAEIWQEVDRLCDHRPPTLCGINFMPITKAGTLIVMVMSWSRSVIKWLPFSENQQNSKGTTCTSQHIYKPLRQNQTTITVTLYWWRTKALTKTRLHKYLGPPNFLKLNKPFQCSKNSLMLCCSQRAQMRVSIWKWKT